MSSNIRITGAGAGTGKTHRLGGSFKPVRILSGVWLEPEVANQIDPGLDTELFPSRPEDPILDYFMSVRNNGKYEGEARRALQGVCFTSD